MGLLHAEPTEKVAEKVLKDFSDIEELKEIVEGILSLVDSEVYEKLIHDRETIPLFKSGGYDKPSDLVKLASKNMSKFPLNIPFAPLLTAKYILIVYTFMMDLYIIRIKRDLTTIDLDKICYGEMAARILFLLEDFDSKQETPQPTAEFFKKLGKIKWKNKKAKKLFNSIREILFVQEFNKWKGAERVSTTFSVTEKAFIKLLSGCSAVVEGRDKINTFDVIRAYKTYLKLIHTDISRLM